MCSVFLSNLNTTNYLPESAAMASRASAHTVGRVASAVVASVVASAAAAPSAAEAEQAPTEAGLRRREPLLLTSAHSHMHWSVCEGGGGGAAGATISGGFSVPAASWQPQLAGQQEQGGTSGLWTAPLPPALSHRRDRGSIPAQAALRTLFVGGARANRTSANASALLGHLRVTADGYEAERPVPWDGAAAGAAVELVYFQQVAPWQAQRCTVAHAAGRSLVVAQPCLARLQSMVRAVPGLPRNTSYGRSGCADPACRQPDGGLLLGLTPSTISAHSLGRMTAVATLPTPRGATLLTALESTSLLLTAGTHKGISFLVATLWNGTNFLPYQVRLLATDDSRFLVLLLTRDSSLLYSCCTEQTNTTSCRATTRRTRCARRRWRCSRAGAATTTWPAWPSGASST